MSEAEHTVVAGILQKGTRAVDVAGLQPEFFKDKHTRTLFTYAQKYRVKHGGKNALDLPLARNRIEKSKAKSAGALLELLEDYEDYDEITDAEWRDSLATLVTDHQRALIKEHGTKVLQHSLDGSWREAREEIRASLLALEDTDLENERPTDLHSREEIEEEKKDLEEDQEPLAAGFDIGFTRLTDRVSFRPTELTVLGGYSADGKTQFAKTLAYNANTRSGANVLFVAMEMEKREMKVLFVCQHASMLDPRGVDYRSILDRNPSAADKKLYHRALDDFCWEDHEDVAEGQTPWGRLEIWSPRKTITIGQYCDRVRAVNSDRGLDMAVPDYLELMEPDREFRQYRLALYDMVKKLKALARETNTWQLVPHQIGRSGRDAAEKRQGNYYLMRDLGESSGVEKASDHVIWVYTDEDLKEEKEAKVGIAKARKGKTLRQGTHIMADFARSNMSEILDY